MTTDGNTNVIIGDNKIAGSAGKIPVIVAEMRPLILSLKTPFQPCRSSTIHRHGSSTNTRLSKPMAKRNSSARSVKSSITCICSYSPFLTLFDSNMPPFGSNVCSTQLLIYYVCKFETLPCRFDKSISPSRYIDFVLWKLHLLKKYTIFLSFIAVS